MTWSGLGLPYVRVTLRGGHRLSIFPSPFSYKLRGERDCVLFILGASWSALNNYRINGLKVSH